jgi:hypothetical protein
MSFALPDNMPSLSLSVPSDRHAAGNIELNEKLLQHWIRQLPSNDPIEFSRRYLDALKRFNGNDISHAERMKLLDMYREPFNKVVLGLTPVKLQKLIKNPTHRIELIHDMADVLNELAKGYKIVIVEADEHSNNLKLKPLIHMAIYRAVEQLNIQALHAYKFYRTLPEKLFRELHQLYLLTEAAGIVDKAPFVNSQYKAEFSVRLRYIQLLLTCISNPYGLADGDVLRVYQLMLQLASAARIGLLDDEAKPQAGHFYINCLSDRPPEPSVLPAMENQHRPPTLMLDTKPILSQVDALFDQADRQGSYHPAADNIQLLRQVVPYLNTSYQRKQARVPVEDNKATYLAVGLDDIHRAAVEPSALPIANHPWLDSAWEVLNKNSYGYLIQKRKVRQAHDLKIGDFVGILDASQSKPSVKLASIRWLRSDDFEQTKLGLKFLHGDPIPVQFSIADNQQRYPAFLIRENSLYQQPAMLITHTGIHAKSEQLTIKTGKKRFNFTVQPQRLLTHSNSFESFTFTDVVD